ncbi:hypothetical protein N7454_006996 [Penicillium verhagenii]|nr:hypothetical protein N7454_006996 [Penicillium verhagenii]
MRFGSRPLTEAAGAWNLRINGEQSWKPWSVGLERRLRRTDKWYRSRFLRVNLDDKEIHRKVKEIFENREQINLDGWIEVPFAHPLLPKFHRLVTIDLDMDVIMVRVWNAIQDGPRTMKTFKAHLTTVYNSPTLSLENWSQEAPQFPQLATTTLSKTTSITTKVLSRLNIELPTAMFELQQRFFIDFVLIWRGWIDDPLTWNLVNPTFYAFSRAFLHPRGLGLRDIARSKGPPNKARLFSRVEISKL